MSATNQSESLLRGLYTVSEISFAVEQPVKLINREIDARVLLPATVDANGDRRLLDRAAMAYLAATRDLRTHMDVQLRRTIVQQIREAVTRGQSNARIGYFSVPVESILAGLVHKLGLLDNFRELITYTPTIASGEPVLAGTRHRVYDIKKLHDAGVKCDEFAREYDLTAAQVQLAVQFATLHPRVGRPQWRQACRRNVVIHVPSKK